MLKVKGLHTWQGTFVSLMLGHQNFLDTLYFAYLLHNLKHILSGILSSNMFMFKLRKYFCLIYSIFTK